MKTAIKVVVRLGLGLFELRLWLGLGLDCGIGFSLDIWLRQDSQLRV